MAAAGWVLAGHVLLTGAENPIPGSGRRSSGALLFLPGAFTALAVYALVKGFEAVRRWRAYAATVPVEQRRLDRAHDLSTNKIGGLWLFAAISALGFMVATAAIGGQPDPDIRKFPNILLWLQWELGLGAGAAFFIAAALRSMWARDYVWAHRPRRER